MRSTTHVPALSSKVVVKTVAVKVFGRFRGFALCNRSVHDSYGVSCHQQIGGELRGGQRDSDDGLIVRHGEGVEDIRGGEHGACGKIDGSDLPSRLPASYCGV